MVSIMEDENKPDEVDKTDFTTEIEKEEETKAEEPQEASSDDIIKAEEADVKTDEVVPEEKTTVEEKTTDDTPPEAAAPEEKTDATPEEKTDDKPEEKADGEPEENDKPEETTDDKPEEKIEEKIDDKPDEPSDDKPEEKATDAAAEALPPAAKPVKKEPAPSKEGPMGELRPTDILAGNYRKRAGNYLYKKLLKEQAPDVGKVEMRIIVAKVVEGISSQDPPGMFTLIAMVLNSTVSFFNTFHSSYTLLSTTPFQVVSSERAEMPY